MPLSGEANAAALQEGRMDRAPEKGLAREGRQREPPGDHSDAQGARPGPRTKTLEAARAIMSRRGTEP